MADFFYHPNCYYNDYKPFFSLLQHNHILFICIFIRKKFLVRNFGIWYNNLDIDYARVGYEKSIGQYI